MFPSQYLARLLQPDNFLLGVTESSPPSVSVPGGQVSSTAIAPSLPAYLHGRGAPGSVMMPTALTQALGPTLLGVGLHALLPELRKRIPVPLIYPVNVTSRKGNASSV